MGTGALLVAAGLAFTLPAAPASATAAAPGCFGERATIVDLREGATVTGTPGRDVIVVRADADVNARGGNDLICGHGDLRGGAGDDRISMRGHPNGELDFVEAFGGPGADEIHRDEPRSSDPHFFIHSYGGPGDDELFGGPNLDVLVGGPGDDRVLGNGLDGVLVGGHGIDTLVGGPSTDRLFGGPGPDRLTGGAHRDQAFGLGGNDVILGGDGADRANGAHGNDRILGQEGVDWADGGPGTDVCRSETVRNCRP